MEERTCAYCGKTFYSTNPKKTCCSERCTVMALVRKYGFTEDDVLNIIRESGEIPLSEISRRLGLNDAGRTALTRLMNILVEDGKVRRRKFGRTSIFEIGKGGDGLNEDVSVPNKDESPEEEVQETSEGIQESVPTIESREVDRREVIEKLESLSEEFDLSEIEEAIKRVRLSNISERLISIEDMVNDLNNRVQRIEDLAERVANIEVAVKKLKEALLELIEAVRI